MWKMMEAGGGVRLSSPPSESYENTDLAALTGRGQL